MKKLLVIGIMLAATVSLAKAQQFQQMSAEERAKVQTERMEKLLTLTAEQKSKIEAIDLELSKEMTKMMQNSQGDREAMRSAMQEIDKKRDEKYKTFLSADQFKKYLEDKAERQRQRGQ